MELELQVELDPDLDFGQVSVLECIYMLHVLCLILML